MQALEKYWPDIRKQLFKLDPENAHKLTKMGLGILSRTLPAWHLRKTKNTPKLARDLFGLHFKNPVGLAAGFDEDASCFPFLQRMGFGFIEVGGVTRMPQPGNPRPRIFRLPEDKALFNRLGFNNGGVDLCAHNLERFRRRKKVSIPIGVNIAKSKETPLKNAAEDYVDVFLKIADVVDYVTINVSSPNTPGLRKLQSKDSLRALLEAICNQNAKRQHKRPLLLKLAPDLTEQEAHDIADVSIDLGLSGLVVSNTSTEKTLVAHAPEGTGGLSGAPIFQKSTQLLEKISAHVGDKIVLIGSGGIMNADNAKEKLNKGAKLLQVYTGFIYGGPQFVQEIIGNLDRDII